ncbi:MAG TPA: replicative DNA helicase [Ktedonobacteraceae bacterium]|jgi:replicative DNA helicase
MEKLLPLSIEAEEGVLGSLLIDPEALDKVVRFLQAEDFYRNAHRQIYASALRLNAAGTPADFVTICDDLEREGQLEYVGGASSLTALINRVPTSGNITHYARIVERTALLRRLIHAAGTIAAVAYEWQDPDVSGALSQAEKLIFELSQRYLLGSRSDTLMEELLRTYMTTLDDRYKNRGRITGVPTGYEDLDRLLGGFQRSDLVILAARPSQGKTQLALNFCREATRRGGRAGYISLEMSSEQLAQRFVAMQSKIEQHRLRTGWIEDEEWSILVDAADVLADLRISIDDTPALSLLQVRSRARGWALERGIQILFIDYLQLITGGDGRRYDNRAQEVAAISQGLKALARELNIPVIALSQLSRDLEKRQDKRPQLSDLRESGALEQDADVVIFLYRDETYNPETKRPNIAEVIVAKQRNGPLGETELYFNPAQGIFRTPAASRFEDE